MFPILMQQSEEETNPRNGAKLRPVAAGTANCKSEQRRAIRLERGRTLGARKFKNPASAGEERSRLYVSDQVASSPRARLPARTGCHDGGWASRAYLTQLTCWAASCLMKPSVVRVAAAAGGRDGAAPAMLV